MNKNLAIIFGVTGQDGSYLAELLLEKGYVVVGVARRTSTDNCQRLIGCLNHPKFTLVEGDITDTHSVMNIFLTYRNVNEVYNLAAQSHVATSFSQPGFTLDVTGKGCLNILQIMHDLDVDARFYQASSSEMFGKNYDVRNMMIGGLSYKEEKYQDENTRFLPQSPYAVAKCAAHYTTRLFREAYGMHASCGILFNHTSPRRGENFVIRKVTKWIGDFIRWKRDVESKTYNSGCKYDFTITHDCISVVRTNPDKKPYGDNDSWVFGTKFPKLRLGNLDAYRDFGHARDYVKAMWMMLQRDTPDDYVVCTGDTHTIREVLDVAFSRIDIGDWSDYTVVDYKFFRPAEVDYLRGDCSKIRKSLGWEREYDFVTLVNEMVDHDVDS